MTTGAKILIVDDEESFLKSTSRILEEEGYTCFRTSNGDEALAAVASEKFDLVLADIRMPGNFQFEFFLKLRSRFPNLPVIVITGYPSIDTAIKSIRIKVYDYIVKPIDLDVLKERIKTCLAETGA